MSRAQVVWVGFLGAMTVVGGMLLLVDGKPAPRGGGVSLSPLASAINIDAPVENPLLQTRVPLKADQWTSIVIHHSGSIVGSPTSIAKLNIESGLTGLAHHFIIGNGAGMDDGQIHIGYRWLDQVPAAHLAIGATPREQDLKLHSISICLVGDGERRGFTDAQMQQLTNLVDSLCRKLSIPRESVYLHSDLAPVNDPGRLFPAGLYGLPVGEPCRTR